MILFQINKAQPQGIDHILLKPFVSAQVLSSFVGSIMSMSPVVDRLASIMRIRNDVLGRLALPCVVQLLFTRF